MNPALQTLIGLLIPFIGTSAGAACVFLMRNEMKKNVEKFLLGFASGVMVAASVWSLLIPAIDNTDFLGQLAFLPAASGLALGMAFLLLLDHIIPHLHFDADQAEGTLTGQPKLSKVLMLSLAVTLHNIPEGMATGVVFASALQGHSGVSMSGAYALALGMAIQNFPEGAVISMPMASEGKSKMKSFVLGTLSGAVEPLAAILTIFLTQFISSLLPYLLSFAAGAMLYVVVEELIPEASAEPHSNHGTIGFGFGFILMMILDVALG
ncbi:MAG: ZIP family metal transporter [Clostridiales bacterium]|nr:ZIP family metal transporter [Clostridiales bacterium]MDD7433142.1 ZIP family metal transporter [Clostridiales bacterium]MDY3061645.1 ZIP family metal transporter [Eubacteriales bacterium]